MPSFHHHLTKLITTTITKYPSIKPTTLSFHTNPNTPPSHSQITKLISQQSDPLLAKEIFDLTLKTYPSYQHSYQTYHVLILKLARFRRFSQMDTLLTTLKNDRNCAVKPSLFTDVIRVYGEANMLDKVVNMFYKILEFDIRPRTKQLNVVLEILVRDRAYLRAAFDLFRCAYRYDVVANVETYNVLMRAFCLSGELSVAYKLFNEMFKRDIVPNVESYRILMQGLCRKSQVNRAVELLDDMLNKGFVPDCLSYTTVLNSLCRKKKLREAYKLLCRMKVKGCNPDIVHYNTVILGFCKYTKSRFDKQTMSARYLRKVLKEQEESSSSSSLAAAANTNNNNSSSSSDNEDDAPKPFINPFDLLNDNDQDQDQESDSNDVDTSTTVKKEDNSLHNKKNAGTTVSSSNKKSKKKKNKKKNKELSSSTNDANSLDAILEELSLGEKKSDVVNGGRDRPVKGNILQVDPRFLNADNELRRIFGSKVVDSVEKSNQAGSSRQNRQGRRVFHPQKKTITVSPSEHWPRWDGSLSMELLENKGGCYYFRYVPSSTYSMAQRQFEQAQATHDLNGIAILLQHHPYHIDSLITLADYFKFSGEPQMSADATAKSLYALECAWHHSFNPLQGNCQLKYTHDTNKPLFTSLFAHMKNMDRRGCHRSALEICKLLISLDSDDPMGGLFCIDYFALRAEEYKWLERFSEEYNTDNSMWLFPNFSYSLAICRFYLEREETSETKSTSSDLMKQALMLHPSVLKKLVAKVPLKEQVWTKITSHSFFGKDQTGSESLDHLINIYVERSYIVWRLPELHNFLKDTALSVIEKMETSQSEARDWACVRKEAFPSEKNEYSHLMVSDFSDSTPTMPPENLQNFVIDPRLVDMHNAGGADNQENAGGGVARPPPREVANRNALAVLFESMLPWVDYGAREEDHENGREQDNQD